MADNYLEKKFEEHYNSTSRPQKKYAPKPVRKVMVTGSSTEVGAAIVRALRIAGHKVTTCDKDEETGREVALRTGADFKHIDYTDAESLDNYISEVVGKWETIDIYVVIGDGNGESPIDKTASIVTPALTIAKRLKEQTPQDSGRQTRLVCVGVRGSDIGSYIANGAMTGMAKKLTKDLQPHRATISCVLPDATSTIDDTARVVRLLTDDLIQRPPLMVCGCEE